MPERNADSQPRCTAESAAHGTPPASSPFLILRVRVARNSRLLSQGTSPSDCAGSLKSACTLVSVNHVIAARSCCNTLILHITALAAMLSGERSSWYDLSRLVTLRCTCFAASGAVSRATEYACWACANFKPRLKQTSIHACHEIIRSGSVLTFLYKYRNIIVGCRTRCSTLQCLHCNLALATCRAASMLASSSSMCGGTLLQRFLYSNRLGRVCNSA